MMAIYLFVMLTIGQIVTIAGILTGKRLADRITSAMAWGMVLPPYIWFSWFSGLVF